VRAALLGLLILLALAPGAAAQGLSSPARYDVPPPGWTRTPAQVLRAVAARPEVRRARRGHAETYCRVYYKSTAKHRWQVSFFAPPAGGRARSKELSQTVVDDRSGRVLESWTGYKVEWTMARGRAGAFGRVANALWLWLPLCALFVLPFARLPLRLLHLDLAVLLAFSVSYAFFGASEIGVSVPLGYPLLLYLLARMLGIAVARSRGREPPPLRLLLSPGALGLAAVFVLGVRCGLNAVGSNVIDVGYASVVGADHVASGRAVYGAFPPDISRGDTYGPVLYDAYVPFEALLPWSGTWDDLPAAHAAAVTFDLLTAAGLWLLGRRLRGPGLGALLAYVWATFPFTLLVTNSNTNDGIVALLVTAAMLALGRPAVRGAVIAAAALTKFAPIVLAPLFATYRDGEAARAPRVIAAAAAGFAVLAVLALAPVALGDGLGTFYDRTLGFQAGRDSPFSVWGLYGLPGRGVALAAAGVLAVAVAFVPRRRDPVSVAALGAAVLIALQLALDHWFYLYLIWFLPLVFVALLAGRSTGSIDAASAGRSGEVRTTTAISHGSSSEES
jgi:Glycosyltransferase family 87